MTIGGWIIYALIVFAVLLIAVVIAMAWGDAADKIYPYIVTAIITVALCVGILVGMNAYYNNTESGKRALKSQESNFNSGIDRIVTIYDVNGKVIKQYEGRFDVEYDDDRILFDDENGKRHVVYYTTGTVAIDEK